MQPIVSGFHPDPTICRVGDTYYLANSSFEYSPGVPIHASNDLVTWRLIGNALDRPSQLRPSIGARDTGIYAPTLRHHAGRFWLATTDVSRPYDGQLILSAENPEGPWTDPVFIPGCIGIDPDLVWDETGIAHLSWKSFHPDLSGIASVPLSLETGELLDEPRLLWAGTGLPHTEGPHVYRVGHWWYLLVAEGGTERGHVACIARSENLHGPYEPAPGNPILTHRSTDNPVQSTGHGDLVQLSDGSWAMAHLGTRPRGTSPGFHVNGRETFIVGIDWVEGWPVVVDDRFAVSQADHSYIDRFDSPALDPRWIAPGAPPEDFTSTTEHGALLAVNPERQSKSMLLNRARDVEWRADVTMNVHAGQARVILRLDDNHWFGLTLGSNVLETELTVGPATTTIPHSAELVGTGDITASITVRRRPPPQPWGQHPEPDMVGFIVSSESSEPVLLGEFDGRYLSTEVAGGFTGRVWGIEILSGEVLVREVRYTSAPEQDRG